MKTKCRFIFFQPSFTNLKNKNVEQYPEKSAARIFMDLGGQKRLPIYDFVKIGSSIIRPELAEENENFVHIEFLKSQDRNLPYDVEHAGPAQALGTNHIGIPTTVSIHKNTGLIAAQTLSTGGAIGANTALRYMCTITKAAQIACVPILNKATLDDIMSSSIKKLEIIAAEPLLMSAIEDEDESDFLGPMINMQDRMNAAQLALTFTADKEGNLNKSSVVRAIQQAMPFLGPRKIKKLRVTDQDQEILDFIGIQQDCESEIEMENHALKLNFLRKVTAIEKGFLNNLDYLEEYKMAS